MLATIMVTSLADNLDVDGQVTLREAILAAELDMSVDGSAAGSGADTIVFHPSLSGTVDLSIIGDLTDGPSSFAITTPITIRGNANGIAITASDTVGPMRLFHVGPTGSLTLESIMLRGGDARGASGTALEPSGGQGRGGAILNQGTLDVVASTLYDNQAMGGAPALGGSLGRGLGGAIYNDGGNVTIRSATLSANAVYNNLGNSLSNAFGGSIYSRNGSLAIDHSTIVNNTATAGRGVYSIADGADSVATLQIHYSIVGYDGARDALNDVVATFDNGGVTVAAGSYNFIRQDIGFSSSPVSRAAPLLGPLADNGGPTWTHALLPGSPAIDWGDPSAVPGVGEVPLFDQRGPGFTRVADGDNMGGARIDIGAFERQAVSAGPALPGDYNQNGVVDAADYTVWRDHYGAQVTAYSGADGNGTGVVDDGDYAVWKAAFGRSSAGAASDVTPDSMSAAAAALINSPWSNDALRAPLTAGFEPALAPIRSDSLYEVQDLALLAVVADYETGDRMFDRPDAIGLFSDGQTEWGILLAFDELPEMLPHSYRALRS